MISLALLGWSGALGANPATKATTKSCQSVLSKAGPAAVGGSESSSLTYKVDLNKKNQVAQWAQLITPEAMGKPALTRDPGPKDPNGAWPVLEILLTQGSSSKRPLKVYAVPAEQVLAWMRQFPKQDPFISEPRRNQFEDLVWKVMMSGRLTQEQIKLWPKKSTRSLNAEALRAVAKGEAYIPSLFLNGLKPLRWTDHFIFSEAFYQAYLAPGAPSPIEANRVVVPTSKPKSKAKPQPVSELKPSPVPVRVPAPVAAESKATPAVAAKPAATPEPAPSKAEVASAQKDWAFLQEKYSLLVPEEARHRPLSLTRLQQWMDPEEGGLALLASQSLSLEDNTAKAFTGWRQQLFETLGLETKLFQAETIKKLNLLDKPSSPLALRSEDFVVAREGRGWSQRLAAARIYIHLVSLRQFLLDEVQNVVQEGHALETEVEYLLELGDVDLARAQGLDRFLTYFDERIERMLETFLQTQKLLLSVDSDLESLTREVFRQEHEQLMKDRIELEARLDSIQDEVLDGRAQVAEELHHISLRAQNLNHALADWAKLLRPVSHGLQEVEPYAESFAQLVTGQFFPLPDHAYPIDHQLFSKTQGIESVVFLKSFVRKMSHLGPDDLQKVKTLIAHITNGFVAEQGQSGIKHHLTGAHKQFILVKHKGQGGRHRLLGGFVEGRLVIVEMRLNEDPPATGYRSISKAICRIAAEAGYDCSQE